MVLLTARGWCLVLLTPVAALGQSSDREVIDPRFEALVPAASTAHVLARGHVWVEGPLWDPQSERLLFTDVARNEVLAWSAARGIERVLAPSGYTGAAPFGGREPGANGLAFDREGRLLLCAHGDRAVVRIEPDGSRTVLASHFDGKRLNSPNDLVVSRAGDLYFTDPPFGLPGTFGDPARELAFSGVYRQTASGELECLADELGSPNGIALSPDERTLYVSNADAARPVWVAYDLARPERPLCGRVLADASARGETAPGLPDGMTVDRAGNLFATGPGGIWVIASDGAHLGTILTGVVTSNVAFGGDAGSTLFATASDAVLSIELATSGGPE